VEICSSVEAVKYIHKYIYKGHDRTTLEVMDQNRNEIKEYLDARYIGAVESCWHMFEFSMHAETPHVYRLPVHLPDEHTVYFHGNDDMDEVVQRGATKVTRLTAWFEANRKYPAARIVTYQEAPKAWVYNDKKKEWAPRKQGKPAIGRMWFVSPSQGERFYLRMLLTVVTGATSFPDLRTVNGIQHPTFKQACIALGLLQDDQEWIQCLTEASQMQVGSSLRSLFALILLHCNPTSPEILWQQFRHHICDDLRVRLQSIYPNTAFEDDDIYMYGLHLINKILIKSDRLLSHWPEMPAITGNWHIDVPGNRLLNEHRDYNRDDLAAIVAQNQARFNPHQTDVFNAVMDSVNNNRGKVFFLHSAGGCGKTFVANTIVAAVRAQGKIALPAASSGIASLLMDGGRTAHSTFHIPIELDEASMCRIPRGSDLHQLLEQTDIIIWDEVPMQHKHATDAVDRTLRDLRKVLRPFSGITILFGGDFRQTLPVVPRGTREQAIAASIKRSTIWPHVNVYHLHQNERLERTPENVAHAAWLLDIGAGTTVDEADTIQIPQHMLCQDNTIEALINLTYPDIHLPNHQDQYYLDRTILTCTNDNVDDINDAILARFPGQQHVFNSADTVSFTEQQLNGYQPYPPEYLNSLKASGLPLSRLVLKEGCPIMLLRNLDPSMGLCNGTRLVLLEARRHVLKCRIISGDAKFAGNVVFIPRITLEPSPHTLPIPLRRHQFPVRLAFAMTINKSQGQSVFHVGLDLRTSAFAHGQLYVALSRCTSGTRIKVILNENNVNGRTANIVYKEVLTGII